MGSSGAKFQRNFIENIRCAGGEGAVLRRPKSLYTHGRSEELIKIKVEREGGRKRDRGEKEKKNRGKTGRDGKAKGNHGFLLNER